MFHVEHPATRHATKPFYASLNTAPICRKDFEPRIQRRFGSLVAGRRLRSDGASYWLCPVITPQRATSRFARQTATMTDPRPQGTRRISHRFPNSLSAEPLLTTGEGCRRRAIRSLGTSDLAVTAITAHTPLRLDLRSVPSQRLRLRVLCFPSISPQPKCARRKSTVERLSHPMSDCAHSCHPPCRQIGNQRTDVPRGTYL
jgi:hypothetical protein